MSGIDIVICVILLIGAYTGFKEGFLMELFSFLAILLGVLGGFKLMGWAMLMLGDKFNVDQKVLPYVAFAVVFIAIVIAVRLLGNLIKVSIDKTFLGRVDQVAGAILGFFKTAFLLSVILWIVDSLKVDLPLRWTADSWILPKVAGFAPVITGWIGEFFPVFKDVF
ncbi:CvpA family protein [Fulvivirgaceae bacterium PWU4]|uniref:CvpA family protein n=1 Tax=Chryseosolibacter histidini TaxID=2782349 RepID=A0AAP2DT48_9BACT|nr:CvpA family protein [Chryseosolibacter histidini]MBT1700049.1 CvpA family protein [Chryseosolibacter histidini]